MRVKNGEGWGNKIWDNSKEWESKFKSGKER